MLFSFEITCRLIIRASRHIVAVTTSKWRVTSSDGYVKEVRLPWRSMAEQKLSQSELIGYDVMWKNL